MGVMAGTVDLMQRAYPGIEIRDGVLRFEPRLPAGVEQVEFWMQFQRTPLLVSLDHDQLVLTVHREGAGGPIRIAVGDQLRELCPGETETFELSSPGATREESERSHGAV
jgi:trehalose/maltose hydrolase-like predicted phosphorylase